MSLSDFDPLTSPAHNSSSGSGASSVSASATTPSSASASSSAASGASPSKAPLKFDSIDYLYAAKWRSLHSDLSHAITLSFEKPRPKAAAHAGEDAVAKALREKAEKEAADKEKAEREREEEQARQEEAKAAAAAGKEAIAADTKKVELPGSLPGVDGAASSSSASASSARPASAADKLKELTLSHEHDVNRYADKSTFHYKCIENTTAPASADDATAAAPSVPSGVEYTGAFVLSSDKSTVTLSDVQKSVSKSGSPPVKSDVAGTFQLALTPDGKKVSGSLDGQKIEFELVDTSSDASLSFLF